MYVVGRALRIERLRNNDREALRHESAAQVQFPLPGLRQLDG